MIDAAGNFLVNGDGTVMDTHKQIREHISALSDGELSSNDVELAFAALQSADGQHTWNTYYRIGDMLRAEATPALSPMFSARLAARLAAEPPPGSGRRSARPDGMTGRRPGLSASTPGALPASAASAAESTGSAAKLPEAQAVVKPKPAVVNVS